MGAASSCVSEYGPRQVAVLHAALALCRAAGLPARHSPLYRPRPAHFAGTAVKAVLVLVHGFTWHSLYFSEFAAKAAAQGEFVLTQPSEPQVPRRLPHSLPSSSSSSAAILIPPILQVWRWCPSISKATAAASL